MEEGNLYRLIDYSNSYIAVKEGMSVYWDLPRLGICKFNNKVQLLARACGVPVGLRSGGRLAMTLVATINVIIFFSFFFLFFLRRLLFS